MKIYKPRFDSVIQKIIYSASGEYSYQIPSGALWLCIEMFGGGGGGGGGAKHSNELISSFGGMPGGYSFYNLDCTNYLSSSIHVTVGAGGAGGASISSSVSSSGFAGVYGGDTYISSGSTIFSIAGGGPGGRGAYLLTLGESDFAEQFIISDLPVRRRQYSTGFTVVNNESASYNKVGGTGGHGGYCNTGTNRYSLGASGSKGYYAQSLAGAGGIYGTTAANLSGSAGATGNWPLFITGGGGGGGGSTGSVSAGPGGNGGIGAGGGGGGSTNAGSSGKGGDGGSGGLKIVAFF